MICDRKEHEALTFQNVQCYLKIKLESNVVVCELVATQNIITKDSIDCSNRNIQSQSINNGIVRDEMACF